MDLYAHELVRKVAGADAHHDSIHHAEEASRVTTAAVGGYCTSAPCLRNWKIAFAVLLFAEGVLFGYIPLILRRFSCIGTLRFRKSLSYINAAGGGVFLATGLLHILPEAIENLAAEDTHKEEHLTAMTGAAPGTGAMESGLHDSHAESHGFPVAMAVILGVFLLFLLLDRVIFRHSHDPLGKKHDDEEVGEKGSDIEEGSTQISTKTHGFVSSAFTSEAVATLGLAVHSVLESVALGSSSRWSTMLNTFIAISAHRWATSMALGSRYARAELRSGAYSVLMVAFALVAPVGIAIGVGVRETSETFIGVVFALSAGTFLYIGAFEAPAAEFVERIDSKFSKFVVFAGGAAVITAITGILAATNTH